MGQRLVIQITENGEPLANAYYHWSAYTGYAADMTNDILGHIDELDSKLTPVQKAVALLYKTGAKFNPVEKARIYALDMGAGLDPYLVETATSRNEGLLCITEEGMSDNIDWEEGRVEIDIADREIYFAVLNAERVDDYVLYNEEYKDYIAPEDLPVLNFGWELELTPDEWDGFYREVTQLLKENKYVAISPDKTTVYEFIA